MSEGNTADEPEPNWYQWRISTWLVLVAILGWGFAIRPAYIVTDESRVLQDGTRLMSIRRELNAQYFGPLLALVGFLFIKLAPAPDRRRPRLFWGLGLVIAGALAAAATLAWHSLSDRLPVAAAGPLRDQTILSNKFNQIAANGLYSMSALVAVMGMLLIVSALWRRPSVRKQLSNQLHLG